MREDDSARPSPPKESDDVVAVGRANGTLRNEGDAGYGFAHVFTLSDGRITRFRDYADPDATLRRLGGGD